MSCEAEGAQVALTTEEEHMSDETTSPSDEVEAHSHTLENVAENTMENVAENTMEAQDDPDVEGHAFSTMENLAENVAENLAENTME